MERERTGKAQKRENEGSEEVSSEKVCLFIFYLFDLLIGSIPDQLGSSQDILTEFMVPGLPLLIYRMVSSGLGSQTCRAGKRGKAKEFAVMEWWRLLDRFAKGYTGHSCSACHFSSNWEAVLHQLNSEWEQEMEHLRTWRVMCYYSRPIPIFSVWSLLFNLNKVIPNYSYFYCPSCTVIFILNGILYYLLKNSAIYD